MSIPLTLPCPQCETEMELVTADESGETVVYECPDCGYQVESPVDDDEVENGQDTEDDLAPEPLDPEERS
jgi:uncharacterized Zn finger protein